MDSWGFVHLFGMLTNGTGSNITGGAVLGVLPAGFRPTTATAVLFCCLNDSALTPAQVSILPNGNIGFSSPSGVPRGNGKQLSFDGAAFTIYM